jgi:hypothetical protein
MNSVSETIWVDTIHLCVSEIRTRGEFKISFSVDVFSLIINAQKSMSVLTKIKSRYACVGGKEKQPCTPITKVYG